MNEWNNKQRCRYGKGGGRGLISYWIHLILVRISCWRHKYSILVFTFKLARRGIININLASCFWCCLLYVLGLITIAAAQKKHCFVNFTAMSLGCLSARAVWKNRKWNGENVSSSYLLQEVWYLTRTLPLQMRSGVWKIFHIRKTTENLINAWGNQYLEEFACISA